MSRPNPTIAWPAALLAAALAAPAGAQEVGPPSPLSDAVVTGYGTLGYSSVLNQGGESDFNHDFSAAVSPVLLFAMGEDFLFEAELEFAIEEETTETSLEYAQVNYLGFDNVQLTAGKFLLPMGLFSERIHPAWINKMPSMPLLYGHAHHGVAEGSLFPVLSDIGVMGRWAQPLGDRLTLDVSAWVTQGPRIGGEEEGEEGTEEPPADLVELPPLAFGTNSSDNNDSKMLGLRAGLVVGGDFEAYVSGFHAMYDESDFLDVYSGNLAFEWRPGRFELRGEGTVLWQQVLFEETGLYETAESPGYYAQASRRIGAFEPIVRWSHLLDSEVESTVAREEVRQLAVGLDYWLSASIPVKAAFEWNLDDEERVLVQWAYGF